MTRMLRAGFDRNVLVPAFGVMFRDQLDTRVIAEGLDVSLCDPLQPYQLPQILCANGHGVFVAHRVSGLRLPADLSPPPTRRYTLQVDDPFGRYLPLSMAAELPTDGLFEPACLTLSPGGALPHVPLFSAPARVVPPGYGEVRVDLALASNPALGAAWARLELRLDDGTLLGEGLADARGSALLLCELPALRDPTLSASPPGSLAPISSWNVTLRAFWDPAIARQDRPDLCDLQQLPEVALLQDLTASTPLAAALLTGGTPLVLRSDGSSSVFVGA